jgi:hypothetical protein
MREFVKYLAVELYRFTLGGVGGFLPIRVTSGQGYKRLGLWARRIITGFISDRPGGEFPQRLKLPK